MPHVLPAVSLLCLGLAGLGSLYALAAAWCVRRFAKRVPVVSGATPSVTVLKPLHGAEPGLYQALSSFCRQDYPAPVDLVLGVQSAQDPALDIARTVIAAHPERKVELVVDAAIHGANRKISNLVNMSGRIRHEVVVLADSDIVVEPDYLARVAAALGEPGVGLVTCLYRGLANAGSWSRLAAAAIDLHFLPSVLVGVTAGLAQPCFGSTIALRRETLEAIGGFAAFNDQLADDYAIGAAVRRLGLRSTIPPMLVGHLCNEATFDDLWRHELRWARTIRLVDPAGFFGSGITHALPLAFLGAAAGGTWPAGWAMVAAALACRTVLQASVARLVPNGHIDISLLIRRDILSFLVFAASFFAARVRWRGFDYKVALGGSMIPVKEDPER